MSHAPFEGTEFEQAGLVPTEFAVAGVSQVVQAPGKPTSQPVDALIWTVLKLKGLKLKGLKLKGLKLKGLKWTSKRRLREQAEPLVQSHIVECRAAPSQEPQQVSSIRSLLMSSTFDRRRLS